MAQLVQPRAHVTVPRTAALALAALMSGAIVGGAIAVRLPSFLAESAAAPAAAVPNLTNTGYSGLSTTWRLAAPAAPPEPGSFPTGWRLAAPKAEGMPRAWQIAGPSRVTHVTNSIGGK